MTIHQKTGIGCLSAFCGATCAGCGAGAGIAYLLGGDYKTVAHTIVNAWLWYPAWSVTAQGLLRRQNCSRH